jgi:hypothetical protein
LIPDAVLQEVPTTVGAVVEEGKCVERIGVLAQDDNPDCGVRSPELVRQAYALVRVIRRHSNIREDDVWLDPVDRLQHLVERAATGDELDLFGRFQCPGDPLACEIAVLAENDPEHKPRLNDT